MNMPHKLSSPMYLQQYNLSIQRQSTRVVGLFGGSYLGNKTTHLPTSYEANPAVFIPGTSTGIAGSCGFLTGTSLPKAGVLCSSTGNTQARRDADATESDARCLTMRRSGTLDDGGVANYNGIAELSCRIARGKHGKPRWRTIRLLIV